MTHYCDSSRYRNPQNVNPGPGVGVAAGRGGCGAALGSRALNASTRYHAAAASQHDNERVHSEVDLFGRRWPNGVWIVLRILAPVEHPVVTDNANLSMSQLFLPISWYGCGVVRV
jgi:hypothetical protein